MTNDQKLDVLAKNQMALKDAINRIVDELGLILPDDVNNMLNGEGGVEDSLRQAFLIK
jgi:hypothetical protein